MALLKRAREAVGARAKAMVGEWGGGVGVGGRDGVGGGKRE